MAALALYLYSFNFYYLTGWPPYAVFIYMIYLDLKEPKIKPDKFFIHKKINRYP